MALLRLKFSVLFIFSVGQILSAAENKNTDNDHRESTNQTLIITASRQAVPDKTFIGNIDKLSKQEVQSVAHNHPQELLVRVPGVNIQRGNGQESLPAIRSPILTGAGACGAFLLAEDNIPLRAAGFCNVNELFEAHIEQAESIEIIRGPSTAFYGSNAVHGIINVLTPDVPKYKTLELGFETGSYNFRRFKGRFGDTKDNQGINLLLTLDSDGGYRDESGFTQQKVSARHQLSTENLIVKSGMTLTNLDQETAGFIVGKNSYRSRILAKSNLNPEAFRDARSARIWSRFDYRLSDVSHILFTPYLRNTRMKFKQHFLPGKPIENNGQKSFGIQSGYYFEGETLYNIPFNFSFGLDLEKTNSFLKQTQFSSTTGSAFLQETIPIGKQYDYKVNATMAAPFFHLDWQFSESWLLTSGIRYEKMSYDYDNLMLDGRTRDDGTSCGFGGCRYSRPADNKNSFTNLSPKLGVGYQLANDALLFANLTRGFRAPQATELYRLQRQQTIADLKSVKLDSYEVGFRSSNVELVYYRMKKRNVIFRDSDFFNISDGRTEHLGIEARLDYSISDSVSFSANATIAKHQYANDQILRGVNINGNDIDTAPRHFGSVQLKWIPSANTKLELEWVHQGSYYTDAENQHKYGGHDLLNLRLTKELTTQWRLFARINNLTDRKYAERADYTFFTQERYFPGMPVMFFLGVKWHGK
ncbi:MAG: TonB-dependent receptor [Kangiellaceae bacterium]|nr:TonB-dependent receptor [Kangiellaceae bacterium]